MVARCDVRPSENTECRYHLGVRVMVLLHSLKSLDANMKMLTVVDFGELDG